jgi:tRNA-2-methylthio-N6-dimethylallyladenosine synthase
VEDRNPRYADQVMGRTRQSRQVFFNGNIDELKGTLVDVKIVEANTWSLVGEVV